ncbi:2'-hydroxyisoflavone reductase [Kribbella antiqua]|uniref:2'-hydroxyisoflavone reductase n=1 Tax=Kribbella antiqua TaxID=2512217 RepID=A0A4R2IRV2_9ACTN|nr:NAD-dependent dehydratase [Kribbella antiqua]TCO48201.1 2'-hydroxyisoflavone reductase [Kribbella antiqua]
MKLLVLGGTKNLGRHVVEAALKAGHDITLFNRGLTNPGLFPSVEHLVGERAAPDALKSGEWDGVIDMSGFLVHDVRRSAELLRDRVGHYTYMSSIAVYADKATPGMTEDGRLLAWPHGAPEDHFTMDLYGPSKVRCESLLEAHFGDRTAAVRSGFVVGPYNPDFGNWGEALAHGKPMECAARPDQPIQYIDARDLAAFLLRLTVDRHPGPYNAVSHSTTISALAETWRSVVPNSPPINWSPAEDRFHLADEGLFQLDNTRALTAGLTLRPPEHTARDYINWIRAGNTPPPPPH